MIARVRVKLCSSKGRSETVIARVGVKLCDSKGRSETM